jgi:5-(carboxyamino)imidazole ribonucleotide mutase
MMGPKVMILMGSASDFNIAEKAVNILETMKITYDVQVASAHRTHQKVKDIVTESTKNGVEVFMGIAGLSAHLPGIIAANTHKPVVGVPVEVKLEGLDALFASVQMPLGAPVATVGIDRGENGAILASQIIGVHDKEVRKNLSDMRSEFFLKVDKDQNKLEKRLKGNYYSKTTLKEQKPNTSQIYKLSPDNKIKNPEVAIIAGSYSDIKVAKRTTKFLDKLGITYDLRILSPIRDPKMFESYMGQMENVKLFIAISGLSAHVTGSVVAYTEKPVIGVPCARKMDGFDALLSMVNMPPGVPVATIGIEEGGNAALLAAEMLAIGNGDLKKRLLKFKKFII